MIEFLLLGLTAGVVVTLLLLAWRIGVARREGRSEAEAAAETRIGELKQQYESRLRDATVGTYQLRTQLEALLPQVAESVLTAKAAQLEQMAGSEMKLLGQQTVGQVSESQKGLEAAVQTLGQKLAEYQSRLQTFETDRAQAQGRLHEQMTTMAQTGISMAQEARTLRQALATSGGVKGRWGEAVLKNILDTSGLNEHVDYDLQVPLTAADAQRLRPDAVIHLPSGRRLIIDAKASLDDFTAGLETEEPAEREVRFTRFATGLRQKAADLARRAYSDNLAGSLPYVVMFVPSEAAFRTALDADPDLFAYGQNLRPPVLLASPSTLVPLMMLVREGWQQQNATDKVKSLLEEVQIFGQRVVSFYKHVQHLGEKLDAAGKAYNDAFGSYRQRLLPRWERLQEMGADWGDAPELKLIENRPLGIDAHPALLASRAAAGGEE